MIIIRSKLGSKVILVLVAGLILCTGFKSSDNYHKNYNEIFEENHQIRLIIIMSGSCAVEYNVNDQGKGKITTGHSGNYADSEFQFTDIKRTSKIKIKNKEKVSELNQLISTIEKASLLKGEHNSDAWRCILSINGQKKIDVYGTMESKELYKLIQLLDCSKKSKLDPANCK